VVAAVAVKPLPRPSPGRSAGLTAHTAPATGTLLQKLRSGRMRVTKVSAAAALYRKDPVLLGLR